MNVLNSGFVAFEVIVQLSNRNGRIIKEFTRNLQVCARLKGGRTQPS